MSSFIRRGCSRASVSTITFASAWTSLRIFIRESDVSLPVEQEDLSRVLTRLRQLKDHSLVQLVTGSVQNQQEKHSHI